jgi:uncharacterized membrane protein
MDSFSKVFFRGLVTLLPIAITIYIVYSAMIILENIFGSILRQLMPNYIPGLGFFFTLAMIYLFGLMLNNFLAAKILGTLERRLTSIPFIKAVYSPLKDLMNLFSNKDQHGPNRVVLVKMDSMNSFAMGLVTRENFSDLPLRNSVQGKIAVYLPFSYGVGGYTLLVSKEQIIEVDLPIEKAMSLAITGWVKVDPKKEEAP